MKNRCSPIKEKRFPYKIQFNFGSTTQVGSNKNIDPQSLRYDSHDFSTARILPGFKDKDAALCQCQRLSN